VCVGGGEDTHGGTNDFHVLTLEAVVLACPPPRFAQHPKRQALIYDEAELVCVLEAADGVQGGQLPRGLVQTLDHNESPVQRLPGVQNTLSVRKPFENASAQKLSISQNC